MIFRLGQWFRHNDAEATHELGVDMTPPPALLMELPASSRRRSVAGGQFRNAGVGPFSTATDRPIRDSDV